jgi:uncharacterized protein YegP (UPF0339 family)
MKLQVFKGKSDIWFVRLVAGNNETMMTSEGYDSRRNAEKSAGVIQWKWETTDAIEVEVLEDAEV